MLSKIAIHVAFATLLVLGLGEGNVVAQPPPATPAATPPPPPGIVAPPAVEHSFAITISPVHLALPVVELAGELKLDRQLSVAAIVGAGSVDVDGLDDSVSVFEIGGHVRYYALGHFDHGMQVGAEAIYVRAKAESGDVQAIASGLALGPFIGYKWTADFGFTIDLQGGAEFVVFGAESSAGNTADESDIIALVNINFGWAF